MTIERMKTMKGIALIIGANGNLGKEFSRKISKDYFTIGTSRGQPTNCEKTICTPNLFLEVDNICNAVRCTSAAMNLPVLLIIYVAGFGYEEKLVTDDIRTEMFHVNVYVATAIANKFSDAKFVYISSCAVLGTTGTKNLETYADTKRTAERWLKKVVCSNLILVRPTKIAGTDFIKRANMKEVSTKGFWDYHQVVDYILSHLHQDVIYPGWQAHMIHVLHEIYPPLAQLFLKN